MLDAAATVFAERGYSHTSVDDIAATAGLTKGAVYSSFGSKDGLFYAMMRDRISERLTRVAEEAALAGGSAAERVQKAGRVLTEITEEEPGWHLAFIEFWAIAIRNPDLREDFATHRRAARQVIADFLTEQAADLNATLPMPAEQIAVVILALSNGLAIEQMVAGGGVDDDLFGTVLMALLD